MHISTLAFCSFVSYASAGIFWGRSTEEVEGKGRGVVKIQQNQAQAQAQSINIGTCPYGNSCGNSKVTPMVPQEEAKTPTSPQEGTESNYPQAMPAKQDTAPSYPQAMPEKQDTAPSYPQVMPAKQDTAPSYPQVMPAKQDTTPAYPVQTQSPPPIAKQEQQTESPVKEEAESPAYPPAKASAPTQKEILKPAYPVSAGKANAPAQERSAQRPKQSCGKKPAYPIASPEKADQKPAYPVDVTKTDNSAPIQQSQYGSPEAKVENNAEQQTTAPKRHSLKCTCETVYNVDP